MEPDRELDDIARQVIGAAIEVHRHLGPGFLEAVYEEALAVELTVAGVPFLRQVPVSVTYRGKPVGEGRLDFLAGGLLIVELKAVESLSALHRAQVLSYLKATDMSLALLINFNVPLLREGIIRVIRSSPLDNGTNRQDAEVAKDG